jgi:hypothetical protein
MSVAIERIIGDTAEVTAIIEKSTTKKDLK